MDFWILSPETGYHFWGMGAKVCAQKDLNEGPVDQGLWIERCGRRSFTPGFELPTIRLPIGCITVRPLIDLLYYSIPFACRGVRH